MPNFVSSELAEALVPESKALWLASDRVSRATEYNHHVAKWEDRMLCIEELWRSPEMGSLEPGRCGNRIERWLRSADEFGMTLVAVSWV